MRQEYDAKFFSDGLPDWKRKRDPLTVRFIFRPLSFWCSAFFANLGWTANDVTLLSVAVAVLADSLFLLGGLSWAWGIAGALLISVWLLLDCTDGNMARCIRKQPYGEFLDAFGSYVLVAFFGIACGICVFFCGGAFLKAGSLAPVVIGALGTIFDLLMRVTHQKFLSCTPKEKEEPAENAPRHRRQKKGVSFTEIKDRAQLELGMGGILPPVILLCSIFGWLDIVLLYLLLYNGASCLFVCAYYCFKAMKQKNKTLEDREL